MVDLLKLPARNDDGDVHFVVAPRGAAAKLEYDPEIQVFTLSKALILGLTYAPGLVLGKKAIRNDWLIAVQHGDKAPAKGEA